MSKANTTSFKKGQRANPNGRPKGSHSPLRRQLMELRNMAADKSKEAFESLWKDFEAGDPLAKQIYFKDLISIPKEWLNEVNTSHVPKEIKKLEDIGEATAALASTLLEPDNMSTEEVHNTIKTLNNIKFTEQFGKQEENVFEKLSDSQLKQLMTWIEESGK